MRVAVTGAFGYSGRYITHHLLEAGHEVITLTNSVHRPNPFGKMVAAFPFHFEEPEKLQDSLRGVQALINTLMMVGLLPITGLALPLVSYGGSSLLANSLAVGLVLNIALRPGYEVTNEPFRFAT